MQRGKKERKKDSYAVKITVDYLPDGKMSM